MSAGKGRRGEQKQDTCRHVGICSNEGSCEGVVELGAHTKITEANLPFRVNQNVAGLDIAVHDTEPVVEVYKPVDDSDVDNAKNLLGNRP